ncbi:DNA/RNA non-specific endonuclease [Crocinitomicaceae bacterium]|nr:DNA/RNA non-specific endonuclease [Crocinitomicaceae bacterium]
MPVATVYTADGQGRPWKAEATISVVGNAAGGSKPTVSANNVQGHMGNAHPYHHERGHLIGKQLGGDGSDARNLVGLSDGTNAPLMTDIENECRQIIQDNGPGASVYLHVEVDYSNTYYNAPVGANYTLGMVGRIIVTIYSDYTKQFLLFQRAYPNGVVKNHYTAGCC